MENSQQNANNGGFGNYMPEHENIYSVIDYRVGFGRRLGAAILDFFIVMLLMFIGFFIVGVDFQSLMNLGMQDLQNVSEMPAMIQISVVSVIVSILYYLTEIFFAASPGKMILGIEIAEADMDKGTFQKLFMRYFLKHISNMFSIVYILSSIAVFNTIGSFFGFVIFIGFFFVLGEKKMAFHDMIAGTAVYYKQDLNAKNTGTTNG